MGNTPSNQHGTPKPRDSHGHTQQGGQPASASSSRHPNLRLPMPSRSPNNLSPSESNPASPSGRSSSPRRRKSLELPDLNKLSFTPAAPVPTTATHTSHHLAPSTTANRPGDSRHTGSSSQSSTSAPSAPKRWQQVLGGGHGPLSKPLGAMSQLDSGGSSSKTAPINMPKGSQVAPPPQPSHYTPTGPHTPTKATPRDVASKESPSRRSAVPTSEHGAPAGSTIHESENDGAVNVPITWTGGGKTVMIAGNFSDNWRGRIPMTKGTEEFHTTLRLKPGQYRLKFIVDDSWRCSKAIPTATDDDGTLVNWIEVEVPKTAEEVKSEWAMDSVPPAKEDRDDSQWTSIIPEPVYLYQYIEEYPHMFNTREEFKAHMLGVPHISPCPQPPALPRLLDKVIVNNDSKRTWDESHIPGWDHAPPAGLDDNSILAVPNHVVLNHLTASAIKNGTLGVGTTTRYRKKYITTMLFKPTLADLKDDQPPAERMNASVQSTPQQSVSHHATNNNTASTPHSSIRSGPLESNPSSEQAPNSTPATPAVTSSPSTPSSEEDEAARHTEFPTPP